MWAVCAGEKKHVRESMWLGVYNTGDRKSAGFLQLGALEEAMAAPSAGHSAARFLVFLAVECSSQGPGCLARTQRSSLFRLMLPGFAWVPSVGWGGGGGCWCARNKIK